MLTTRNGQQKYRRAIFSALVGTTFALMALVGSAGLLVSQNAIGKATALAIAGAGGALAYRAYRMASITASRQGFTGRTFLHTYRFTWNQISKFETWGTASGYGGRGKSIRVVLNSGGRANLGEFWSPALRTRRWAPDCEAIVTELNEYLDAMRQVSG